jgi:Leucine-rich repeat (LRR) protein
LSQLYCTTFEILAKEIKCEVVLKFNISLYNKYASGCDMLQTTSINSRGVTISMQDNEMDAILLFDNKKVSFLPENIDQSFSNLKFFYAENCSVKEVSYANFKGLDKLTTLYLNFNQIEKITSDTLKDLRKLEELALSKIFENTMKRNAFV